VPTAAELQAERVTALEEQRNFLLGKFDEFGRELSELILRVEDLEKLMNE
jgi:hypothetical protein